MKEILNVGDVGRSLDSLQPFPLQPFGYGRENPRKKCIVKGCSRKQRLRVFYGGKAGYQNQVGICPEHACDIVNAYIDLVNDQATYGSYDAENSN